MFGIDRFIVAIESLIVFRIFSLVDLQQSVLYAVRVIFRFDRFTVYNMRLNSSVSLVSFKNDQNAVNKQVPMG